MQVLSRKLKLTDGGYPFAQFNSYTSQVLDTLASQPWFFGYISKQDLARIANGEGVASDRFKRIICEHMNIWPITAKLVDINKIDSAEYKRKSLVELTGVMLNIIEYADFEKTFNAGNYSCNHLESVKDFISVMDESISKNVNDPLRVRFNSFVGKIHLTSLNEISAAVQIARLLNDTLVGGIPHEGATLNLLTDLRALLTSFEAGGLSETSERMQRDQFQEDLKNILGYLSTASAMSNKQIARAFLELFSLAGKILKGEKGAEYRSLMGYYIGYMVQRAPVNDPEFAMEYLAAITKISRDHQSSILHEGRRRFCLEDREVAHYVLTLMKPMKAHHPGSHLSPADPIVAILGSKIDFTDKTLREGFLAYIEPLNEGTRFKIWRKMLDNDSLPEDLKDQIIREVKATDAYAVIKRLER